MNWSDTSIFENGTFECSKQILRKPGQQTAVEHFMLNEINKWKQNEITTELDNNTFAQPNNVPASFTFVINAEIEWAYTFQFHI